MNVSRFQVIEPFSVKIRGKGIITLSSGQVLRITYEEAAPLVDKGMLCPIGPNSARNPVNVIEDAIRQIEETYAPGAMGWVRKTRPDWWRRIVALEEAISRAAKADDMPDLEKFLDKWREEIKTVISAFLERNAEHKQGELFS